MVKRYIIGTHWAVEMWTLKNSVRVGRITLTTLASIGPMMLPNIIEARTE
jgi:hypothetical protein